MVRRYLGSEALIGQVVPWCRGSNWSGGILYLGAEALIGQDVPWYRGSNWTGGTVPWCTGWGSWTLKRGASRPPSPAGTGA